MAKDATFIFRKYILQTKVLHMYKHAYLFITCKWLVVVMLFIKIFFICTFFFFTYTSILDLGFFSFSFACCVDVVILFLKSFSLKTLALKPLLCWTNKGVRQHVSEASRQCILSHVLL